MVRGCGETKHVVRQVLARVDVDEKAARFRAGLRDSRCTAATRRGSGGGRIE